MSKSVSVCNTNGCFKHTWDGQSGFCSLSHRDGKCATRGCSFFHRQVHPYCSRGCAEKDGFSCGPRHNSGQYRTKSRIEFYDKNQPYYKFTNFYEPFCKVLIDGRYWPTTEHYFQAMKFQEQSIQDMICQCATARQVYGLANSRSGTYRRHIRGDWEQVKDAVMWKALFAKFTQCYDLRLLLCQTGDAVLVEASPYDPYWGYGPNKDGENKLGKMLMQLRSMLK